MPLELQRARRKGCGKIGLGNLEQYDPHLSAWFPGRASFEFDAPSDGTSPRMLRLHERAEPHLL